MNKRKMLLVLLALSLVVIGCKKAGKTYAGPPAQKVITIGGDSQVFDFWMGSPTTEDGRNGANETPHKVKVERFKMMTTEIYQKDFNAIASKYGIKESPLNNDATEGNAAPVGDNFPVTRLKYVDLLRYANALSEEDPDLEPVYDLAGLDANDVGTVKWDTTKNGWRLPSEAEWEFAAKDRADTSYKMDDPQAGYQTWPCGQKPDISKVNIKESAIKKPVEVGSYSASKAYALYDMYGNVDEFVWGNWDANYAHVTNSGATGKPDQTTVYPDFVVKGGVVTMALSASTTSNTLVRKGGCYNEAYAAMRPSSRMATPNANSPWGARLVRNFQEGIDV
jgi:formylglycine-generating enzyme required for sulfatase activity